MMIARAIMMILLAALFGVLLVAQQASAVHLGFTVRRLQSELTDISEQNRRLLCEISVLSQPARIASELDRLHIALMDPVALTRKSMDAKKESTTSAAVVPPGVRRPAPPRRASR